MRGAGGPPGTTRRTPWAQVRDGVVSDQEGDHDLVVPQRGIWGTAGVHGLNIDK